MSTPVKLLLAEDSEDDARLVLAELKHGGFEIRHERVESAAAMSAALKREAWDAVISDYNMPGFSGLDALRIVRSAGLDIPFILISGTVGEEIAVDAMKAGASDYVLKVNLSRLAPVLERELADAAMRSSHRRSEEDLHRFRAAMDVSADSIYLTDPESMRFVYLNNTACQRLGYSREQLLQLGPQDVLPMAREQIGREFDEVIAAGERSLVHEHRFLRGDGSEGWTELHRRALRSESGTLIVTIGRDISERKQAEDQIRRLNRIYAVLSGINSLIVRVRDRDDLFREVCRIAVEHGGFGMAWIGQLDPATLDVTPVASSGMDESTALLNASARDDIAEGQGMIGRAIRGKTLVVSNDINADPTAGGARRDEALRKGLHSIVAMPFVVEGEVQAALTLFARGLNFFSNDELKLLSELAGDISFALDHIQKREKIDYLAYYDQLTGVANRRLFQERLAQQLLAAEGSQTKVAVLVADIERFRMINDSLGRQAGDALLKQLVERLARTVDRTEIARIASDLFAILLPEVKGRSEIGRTVEQIWRSCLDEPFRLNDTDIRIALRGGIALFPSDGTSAEVLFRNAEAAWKKAKQSGERYLFHAPEMTARNTEKLLLENKLRQALEKDEFVLHYQPKVDLETRRIVGVEALIRWQSPERGLVPPGLFIPLLEETGLILQAGAWALRRATLDHGHWLQQRVPAPRIAVNVSAIQLRQRDFVEIVKEAIAGAADPTAIDVEITESLLMEDIAGNIKKLKALRDLGMKISIDDFGTGYSSLGYLAQLPVHTLKIDRSFIMKMQNDPNAMMLVQTIISLAHSLRLSVVAEGVEHEEQAKMLRLLRCDEMQGYLFSKPVPKENLTALLRDSK